VPTSDYRVGNDEAIYGGGLAACMNHAQKAEAKKRAPDFNRVRQELYFRHMKGLYRVAGEEPVQIRERQKSYWHSARARLSSTGLYSGFT
jgi:hypothetical protein